MAKVGAAPLEWVMNDDDGLKIFWMGQLIDKLITNPMCNRWLHH